jgi:uncharacterized metal-binding protein YceD (DUF177 family)
MASGKPAAEALVQVHLEFGSMTAGCNPAHRSPPLSMLAAIADKDLAACAMSEARLTHHDPLAGEVGVPCRIELDYRQTSGTFHFHGRLDGAYSSQCARCLDPVNVSVRGEFDLVVRRSEHGGEAV